MHKRFHFSTILSVIYNQKLSGETASLLSYLLDREIRDEQVLELMPSCRDDLLSQFPFLYNKEIMDAFVELNQKLEKGEDNNNFVCSTKIIRDWLLETLPICRCNEMLVVLVNKKNKRKPTELSVFK